MKKSISIDQIRANNEHWNDEGEYKIRKLIRDFKHLFYKGGDILNVATTVKHGIKTTTDFATYSRMYSNSLVHDEEIEKQIEKQMLNDVNIHKTNVNILKSKSSYIYIPSSKGTKRK